MHPCQKHCEFKTMQRDSKKKTSTNEAKYKTDIKVNLPEPVREGKPPLPLLAMAARAAKFCIFIALISNNWKTGKI